MTARVVIGASFGDESKGKIVDWLCATQGAGIVVRFNGGSQSGHTVITPEGERHIFRHIGSGTFLDVPTFLSQFFVVNPILFMEERQQLIELGFHPVVYAHPECLVTTFADMMINQMKETLRGANRHGSCFVAETKVPLLDGTEKTLIELVELFGDGTPFWVYSCTSDGDIVPGLARLPRKTGTRETIAVTLDNGETIKCTREHPFMLRDGTYRQAGLLRQGDSLMPLYRRQEPISKKCKLEYEQVFVPNGAEWKFTHRIVHPKCKSGNVRHHKDLNRFNNRPDNIEEMAWEKHKELHQRLGVKNADWLKEPANRKLLSDIALANGNGQRGKAVLIAYNRSDVGRARTGERGRIHGPRALIGYNKSQKGRETSSRIGREFGKKNRPPLLKNSGNHRRYRHAGRLEDCSVCQPRQNHKVVSVTRAGIEDVYDLTVDRYGNFALSSGVFVHNCGVGFHETMVRSKLNELKITMADLWNGGKRLEAQLSEICTKYASFRLGHPIDVVHQDTAIAHFISCCNHFAQCVNPLGIGQCKDPVFEGGQGLLLDQDNKQFFPHVTHSHTGMANVEVLCAQAGISSKEIYYVSRTYLTRHGAGPLPGEDAALSYADDTNRENQFQGPLRFAPLDAALLHARCRTDARLNNYSLVLTHCDQRAAPCEADLYSDGPTRNDVRHEVPTTKEVTV